MFVPSPVLGALTMQADGTLQQSDEAPAQVPAGLPSGAGTASNPIVLPVVDVTARAAWLIPALVIGGLLLLTSSKGGVQLRGGKAGF